MIRRLFRKFRIDPKGLIFDDSRFLKMHEAILEPKLELQLIDKYDGWSKVYQHICTEAQARFELSYSDARRKDFVTRNRYKDVNPYNHCRVKLKRNDIDYINASRVEVPAIKRTYILTQGPLPHTASHFWVMVWERRCPAILMLNKFVEKDSPKCHPYFPRREEGEIMIFEDVDLKVTFVKGRDKTEDFVSRLLRVEDIKTGESLDVLHFHYVMWPDFGVPPSPDSFLELFRSIRGSGVLDDPERPAVVHCSAGVGRSGVFCLVDACFKIAETSGDLKALDIRGVLVEMRRYRMGLIQTPGQLRFAYQALVEALKSVESKEEEPMGFTEDQEMKFVQANFSASPTVDSEDDEDDDGAATNASLNSHPSLDRSGVALRGTKSAETRRVKKRCSLGRFAPHPGSVEDPESVWLINNSTIVGEPVVIKAGAPSEGFCPSNRLIRRRTSSLNERMRRSNDGGGEEGEEDGYYGDKEGSGVDEEYEGYEDEEEEQTESCPDGLGCHLTSDIVRRPLPEREKHSRAEIEEMLRSQERCPELVELRRKTRKIRVAAWSAAAVVLGLVVYRAVS